MEDIELKSLWKSYEQQLEQARVLNMQSWVLNFKSFEFLQTQKAKSRLNKLATFKLWMIVAGIGWAAVLTVLLVKTWGTNKPFFIVSVGAILFFTLIAIFAYLYQVILIRKIDDSDTVLQVQDKTAHLQASTLWTGRVLFLQMPFYSTFFLSPEWVMSGDPYFWGITFPIIAFFIFGSIWLYRNINYKNVNKKWFRLLFSSAEWTSITRAQQYLKEIDDFRNDRA